MTDVQIEIGSGRGKIVLAIPPNAVGPNAAWSVADWYVDPVSGDDSRDGLTPSTAVRTIMGGIIARWGTTSPILKQNTTIHLLSTETAGQEDVVLSPIVTQTAWFAVVGVPKLIASFSLGAVTAKARGNPGTLLQAAGFTAPGLATGQLVVNTTSGKQSECWIYALGGGVATLSQPLVPVTPAADASNFPASPPAQVNTWAINDTVEVYEVPLLNLKVWQPAGGDTSAASIGGVAWLQNVFVPDVAGTPGYSYLAVTGTITGCVPWVVSCRIQPYVEMLGQSGGGVLGGFAVNCYLEGGAQVENASMWAGACLLYGVGLGTFGSIDGDAIVESIGLYGADSAFVGAVYVHTSYTSYGGGCGKLDPTAYGTGALWGPASLALTDRSTLQLVGGTWVDCLFLSPLTIEGVGTGTSYAGGIWTDGIDLTPTNLDAHSGSLQNPRTNCGFFQNA